MLTRIEIDGFKSFLDFALDVPPFLALVGPNSSGKSNAGMGLADEDSLLAPRRGGYLSTVGQVAGAGSMALPLTVHAIA